MYRLLIFLAGCAFGYVAGGFLDGHTDVLGDPDQFPGTRRMP